MKKNKNLFRVSFRNVENSPIDNIPPILVVAHSWEDCFRTVWASEYGKTSVIEKVELLEYGTPIVISEDLGLELETE